MISTASRPLDLTVGFLAGVREAIEEHALVKANAQFVEQGWHDYQRAKEDLKPIEQAQNFFDYDACVIGPMAEIARRGSSEARRVVNKILENTDYYFRVVRRRHKPRLPLRRLQLHLILALERLFLSLDVQEVEYWIRLIRKNAKLIIKHASGFRLGRRQPFNGMLAFGLNHYCLMCEGIWYTGRLLIQPDMQRKAEQFCERVMDFAPPDGYFEEHTNLDHEGGPSLRYTPMSAGCLFSLQRWTGRWSDERFLACDRFQRNMVGPDLQAMCFADERSNDRLVRPFGLAIHSLTPEGRGYLRTMLDSDGPLSPERLDLQKLGRTYFEVEQMKPGSGVLGAPFVDGGFRITLPLGIKRCKGWVAGLSTLKALNREIAPNNDYALDRQNLLYLAHDSAGVILSGMKSKNDVEWSTLSRGQDGYPVKTGTLTMGPNSLRGTVHYREFRVDLTWFFGEQVILELLSRETDLTLRLPLELGASERLSINAGPGVLLGQEPIVVGGVQSLSTGQWSLECPLEGELRWPVQAFSPYHKKDKFNESERRAMFSVHWDRELRLLFRCRPPSD